jgi:glycosyltransferase involved in cell wall biosynthesis
MWKNNKVSLILPTYNEKDSIKKVIQDFESLGFIDEILVINNNAADGTTEEVAQTNAIEIFEYKQGYGAAIQRGFSEAMGDLLFVCEPDDTFLAKDVFKFLSYIEDVDVVFGSRTVKTFIWEGANMGWFLRWGNWAVAKLMEVMYNTNSLSDVGCTYRLIRSEALSKIQRKFKVTTNFFGPEMMLLAKCEGLNMLQIPVNYKDRVGESSVTGDLKKAFVLGLQMIWLILTFRFTHGYLGIKRKQ